MEYIPDPDKPLKAQTVKVSKNLNTHWIEICQLNFVKLIFCAATNIRHCIPFNSPLNTKFSYVIFTIKIG